jgi:RNA polymerase sigma factor (sigma-70 family)
MIFSKSFVQYTNELNKEEYSPLSREEERKLLQEMKEGDEKSKERIVKAHLRFVIYLLREFKIPVYIDIMDLVQEGNEGLLEGVSRFDVNQTCRVFSYARYYIKWYISRSLEMYSKNSNFYEFPIEFNFDEVEDVKENVKEFAYDDILQFIKSVLNEKETKIISLSFGLEPPFKANTLRDIGSMLHLDAERIRQIKKDALIKIKNKQNTINLLT